MSVEISHDSNTVAAPSERKKLVEVNHLVKYFPVRAGLMQRVKAWVKAAASARTVSARVKRASGLVSSAR